MFNLCPFGALFHEKPPLEAIAYSSTLGLNGFLILRSGDSPSLGDYERKQYHSLMVGPEDSLSKCICPKRKP